MQTLAALLTPTIAVVGALIAFMQWRTAHQKVLLDLFERRSLLFDQIMEMQLQFLRKAQGLTSHEVTHLHEVRAKAQFLFGEEISTALKIWHEALIDFTVSADAIRFGAGTAEDHRPIIAKASQTIRPFRETFPTMFAPYMRMDQKRVRTPAEWLHDRNEIRKSYDDQL